MPLLSVEFLLFFLLFFPLYWSLRTEPQWQNALLLSASLGWLYYLDPYFMLTVIGYSFSVAFFATAISRSENKWRRLWFSLAILFSVACLALFKLADFFLPSLKQWLNDDTLDILMPLGVSYYVFQSIAYLVSLYRTNEIKLQWQNLLLHFSFFPTITSGPISRVENFKTIDGITLGMGQQLNPLKPRTIIFPALAIGLVLMGIAKKWWLASFFANTWVDPIFSNPMQYDSLSVLMSIYSYTLQLFFDFSGYSDLVLGLGMLLGFRLPNNFRSPLIASNLRDYWERWHISLSTWIRDHIYIPLGGSRKGFVRTQLHLIVAMVFSGWWHGNTLNFVLWGFIHAIGLVLLNVGDKVWTRNALSRSTSWFVKGLGIFFTFNFVAFAFVFFRMTSFDEALLLFQSLLSSQVAINGVLFNLFTVIIVAFFLSVGRNLFRNAVVILHRMPLYLWIVPIVVAMVLVITLSPSGIPGFIYANF